MGATRGVTEGVCADPGRTNDVGIKDVHERRATGIQLRHDSARLERALMAGRRAFYALWNVTLLSPLLVEQTQRCKVPGPRSTSKETKPRHTSCENSMPVTSNGSLPQQRQRQRHK